MRQRVAALVAAMATTVVVGACSVVPPGQPVDVVRSALARIAVHDLAGSDPLLCAERRGTEDLLLMLGAVFEPVGALPGFDVHRTMSVIDLDVTGLTVTERGRHGETAEVAIDGVLIERFDPTGVETLFRAYAFEMGQPIEQELLDQTLANVSNGPVEIEVHDTVSVIQEDETWRICPGAPQPSDESRHPTAHFARMQAPHRLRGHSQF